ncbi:mechanosensitive ion channel family protein [Marinihelvus fidelis]|nr:mechanosensitive ion channel domain-containing protein [Marinihelvus fidelis]
MFASLENIHPLAPHVVGMALLLLLAWLADIIVKRILLGMVARIARRTEATWDNALVESKVFQRLAWIMPVLVVHYGVNLVPGLSEGVVTVVRNVATAWTSLAVSLAGVAALDAVNAIYEQRPESRERPIKGFLQMAQLVLYIIGGILVISVLIDRSPLVLLGGLGAMGAVAMIVFKDTLLSLAASIQLTSQKVIQVGDWLELPQYGADGDVIDVALYTITVQNWDKTITVIPTHRVMSDSFKNWRGMTEAGGRRIKRSIYIDMNSIRFLDDAEIERFKRFRLLQDYIADKQAELDEYNAAIGVDSDSDVNLRRLTNIGTLRAYIVNYLRNHPAIHDDMTLIVRQLQPGRDGLPIEIYCFTNDTQWATYEGVQSDLFDHVSAIVPAFGLRLFQSPSGFDLAGLAGQPGQDALKSRT